MTDVFILTAYTISWIIVFLGTLFLVWASLEFRAERGDKDMTSDVRLLIFIYTLNVIILSVTGYSHIIDYVRA
jgi:heme/copper-type cytochrome/quinol oxidase subunit 2